MIKENVNEEVVVEETEAVEVECVETSRMGKILNKLGDNPKERALNITKIVLGGVVTTGLAYLAIKGLTKTEDVIPAVNVEEIDDISEVIE